MKKLNCEQKQFLEYLERVQVLEAFIMDKSEIKIARQLCKLGLVTQGTSENKQGGRIFYINEKLV